jgi:hypothetical protein
MHINQFTPVAGVGLDYEPKSKNVYKDGANRFNKKVETVFASVAIVVRWRDMLVSVSEKMFELPSAEIGKDSTGRQRSVREVANELMSAGLGFSIPVEFHMLGAFNLGVGHTDAPVYLVGCFIDDETPQNVGKHSVVWVDEDQAMKRSSWVPKRLLELLFAMKPHDEFGADMLGQLIIWPRTEEQQLAA